MEEAPLFDKKVQPWWVAGSEEPFTVENPEPNMLRLTIRTDCIK